MMSTQQRNFLLIDDDAVFNFLNEKILRHLHLAKNVLTANNGANALEVLKDLKPGNNQFPEIIFLDLNMPVMDGFSFIESLNAQNISGLEKVVIVILTSSLDRRDQEHAARLGIKYFISKPLCEEVILDIIKREFVNE